MAPIRVLVVDDSAVIRRLVTTVLEDDPEIVVAGTANNGKNALDRIGQLKPDLVTLDVEMPVMDGLECMRAIRKTSPTLPVIMFSTLTERGATATLDALGAGARDYVTKPANVGSFNDAVQAVKDQLIPKIKALCGRTRPQPSRRPLGPSVVQPAAGAGSARTATATPRAPRVTPVRSVPSARTEALVIGCSTGGPDALTHVLRGLPGDFPVPVLVVQHMPPVFTKLFAERLDRACRMPVTEAKDGDLVRAGRVLVAPGDQHMEVRREGTSVKIKLHDGPQENYCRPAVDVMFRSAVPVWGSAILALILTGMGRDGVNGADAIVRAGGRVIAQDEATSVVWGMPGAVAQEGLATAILPLDSIAPTLLQAVGAGSGSAVAAASR